MIFNILNKDKKDKFDDWAICIDFSDKDKTVISIIPIKRKDFDIYEGKKVASEILGCKYVDGKNLQDGDKYLGGIYIDDMECYSMKYKAVVINEFKKVSFGDTYQINKYINDKDIVKNLLETIHS